MKFGTKSLPAVVHHLKLDYWKVLNVPFTTDGPSSVALPLPPLMRSNTSSPQFRLRESAGAGGEPPRAQPVRDGEMQ